MSAALFIVTIPTEKYERSGETKSKKLVERTSTVKTKDDDCASNGNPLTPNMDPKAYGAFSKPLSESEKRSTLDRDAITVNIEDNTPTSRKIYQKNGSAQKNAFHRTMSFDHGLDSPPIEKKPITNNNNLRETKSSPRLWDEPRNCSASMGPMSNEKVKNVLDASGDKKSLKLSTDTPMEIIMIELIKKLKIENAFWQISRDKNYYQISFTVDDYRHEVLLNILNEWGIGDRDGTTVSMIPYALHNKPNEGNTIDPDGLEYDLSLAQKQTAWNRFMKSVRARLNVAQIVHAVKQDAALTFDFVTLLVVAAILAAFGLVENSTVFLASSMLISPLMGPIIATIFGVVIKDQNLARLGLVNELIGISLATLVGFCFGLIFCASDNRFALGNYDGITIEMKERGELSSLVQGVMIAIPSGAAVAIAILGENIGSLVGVAISASLLPPAVNSGILWALSFVYLYHQDDDTRYKRVIKTDTYSDNQATELAIYGAISMLLTIINVICIWVMGIILLKVKEVAPVVSKSQRQFWKHDIKVARDYNKTCYSGADLEQLANEIADFQGTENLRPDFLLNIDRASYQNTWSPMGSRSGIYNRDAKPTLADLEKLYVQMSRPPSDNSNTAYGYSYSKTFMGRMKSPTKYRSLDDHIFPPPGVLRRASMPFNSTFGMASNNTVNLPNTSTYGAAGGNGGGGGGGGGGGYRGPQLEKINEVSFAPDESLMQHNAVTREINSQDLVAKASKKSRNFIVTPAPDF